MKKKRPAGGARRPIIAGSTRASEATRGAHTMNRNDYLKALNKLGLTPAGKRTAALLGLSIRQLIRLAHDDTPVSKPVELLIQSYLRHGLPEEA